MTAPHSRFSSAVGIGCFPKLMSPKLLKVFEKPFDVRTPVCTSTWPALNMERYMENDLEYSRLGTFIIISHLVTQVSSIL